MVDNASPNKIFDVDLTYITSRGNWYYASWKGDTEKSGGIILNIGIHFFDMLMWIFGNVVESKLHLNTHDRAAGFLKLEKARIKWFLSISSKTLPQDKEHNKKSYRNVEVEGLKVEMDSGFENLHTVCYSEILAGKGHTIKDSEKSIKLVYDIRNSKIEGFTDRTHELARLEGDNHPFET